MRYSEVGARGGGAGAAAGAVAVAAVLDEMEGEDVGGATSELPPLRRFEMLMDLGSGRGEVDGCVLGGLCGTARVDADEYCAAGDAWPLDIEEAEGKGADEGALGNADG